MDNSTSNLNHNVDSNSNSSSAIAYETQHVHSVYDEIASHFSQTRYKPWPIVSAFIQSIPSGSVGLDIGCGNGKYLSEKTDIFILASDMSEPLLRLAAEAFSTPPGTNPNAQRNRPAGTNSLLLASTLALPHPNSRFDFAICIAVVHHLSTRERRVQAVKEILACLKTTGKALIYVWALEQKSSRRGWDEGHAQDVMVPWVMKQSRGQCEDAIKSEKVYQRYYHLYRKGELEEDVRSADGNILDGGYEKDNWWVIISKAS